MGKDTDQAGQTPKSLPLRGWLFLAALFGPFLVGLWGRATHNYLLMVAGFAPLLLLTAWVVMTSRLKAARDPAYAARIKTLEQKAWQRRQGKLRGQLIGLAIAMAFVIPVTYLGQTNPAFRTFMLHNKLLVELGGGLMVAALTLAGFAIFKALRGPAR